MIKAYSLLIILFLPFVIQAQQTTAWIEQLEYLQSGDEELQIENRLRTYLDYDFSSLLVPRTKVLGFIGEHYQRIHINFNSVVKDPVFKNIYQVSGTTVVRGNSCDFKGQIVVEQVREFNNLQYGVDDSYTGDEIKAQGILIGRFFFAENPEQSHVGIFSGIMTTWWCLDSSEQLQYNDLGMIADGYGNNQYVGSWMEYGKLEEKVCNWGEYRIPFSGDLDVGAAEFYVNPDYYDRGWEAFDRH